MIDADADVTGGPASTAKHLTIAQHVAPSEPANLTAPAARRARRVGVTILESDEELADWLPAGFQPDSSDSDDHTDQQVMAELLGTSGRQATKRLHRSRLDHKRYCPPSRRFMRAERLVESERAEICLLATLFSPWLLNNEQNNVLTREVICKDGCGEYLPEYALYSEAKLSEYMKKLFTLADKDEVGVIEADDLERLLHKSGFHFPNPIISRILEAVDTSGDGTIPFDEYQQAIDVICQEAEPLFEEHQIHRDMIGFSTEIQAPRWIQTDMPVLQRSLSELSVASGVSRSKQTHSTYGEVDLQSPEEVPVSRRRTRRRSLSADSLALTEGILNLFQRGLGDPSASSGESPFKRTPSILSDDMVPVFQRSLSQLTEMSLLSAASGESPFKRTASMLGEGGSSSEELRDIIAQTVVPAFRRSLSALSAASA